MSDPWFKFFPEKWQGGVSRLKPFERSVYMDLLCEIYAQNGPIENNPKRLSRLCGTTPAPFTRTLEALVEMGKLALEDGKISNPTAEKIIQERDEKRDRRSRAAKRISPSGVNEFNSLSEKTQINQRTEKAFSREERERDRKIEGTYSKSKPHPSNSKSVRQSGGDRPTDDLFLEFWEAYPHAQPSCQAKAQAEWDRLSQDDQSQALSTAKQMDAPPRDLFAWTWLAQREWLNFKPPPKIIQWRQTPEQEAERFRQLQAAYEDQQAEKERTGT